MSSNEPFKKSSSSLFLNRKDLSVDKGEQQLLSSSDAPKKHLLGPWKATAICGNDISSSCLYVSALCIAYAGVMAPFVLLTVSFVLYLFRTIYAEVGSALPLNGGTYTVLLNTTNKKLAAGAACLSLLSYIATAVISANEAIHYIQGIVPAIPSFSSTIGLIGFFAFLAIIGIGESAAVAVVIFFVHLTMLTTLAIAASYFVITNPQQLLDNFSTFSTDNFFSSLIFGFAAAMLGISGFESSANFIEEQDKGVFPITLRNMWVVVSVFNPLICFLCLGFLPLNEIKMVPPDLLAKMGGAAINSSFATFIGIDAFLVLSGAVLTSFVGVGGLMKRMSLDRCLPQFLLKENNFRHTNHWIIISFFLVCASILWVTGGKTSLLAGVYAISFLSVMALFAIGNMLLKIKRSRLPRDVHTSWTRVIVSLFFVLTGIVGNILLGPQNFQIFLFYYGVAVLAVTLMFLRVQLLRLALTVFYSITDKLLETTHHISKLFLGEMNKINSIAVAYFTAGDNIQTLNNAVLYVLENEQTKKFVVVHVYEKEENIPSALQKHIDLMKQIYPDLQIEFYTIQGAFGPQMINLISKKLGIPKNNMFIGTPGDRFPHRIETLGGVRLIL